MHYGKNNHFHRWTDRTHSGGAAVPGNVAVLRGGNRQSQSISITS